VNGAGRATMWLSGRVRLVQSGFVRFYAAVVTAGALLVLAWFLWRGWM
jgi:hypothetical protein